jgi:hypothetical protein
MHWANSWWMFCAVFGGCRSCSVFIARRRELWTPQVMGVLCKFGPSWYCVHVWV